MTERINEYKEFLNKISIIEYKNILLSSPSIVLTLPIGIPLI